MKKIRYITFAIYGLISIFVAVGYLMSPQYQVKRSVLINAPADEVHIFVGNLERWQKWTQWQQADPTLTINVLKAEGIGATQRWSNASTTGSLTVTRSDTWYGIDYDLVIDDNPPARAGIHYYIEDDATRVEWTVTGFVDIPIAGPYMAMMMDSFMGATLESSLVNLKNRLEQ